MAKKNRPACWCGKLYDTENGLRQHKRKADHFKTPAEKAREAEEWGKKFEAAKRRTEKYVGAETYSLANGRHLKVGDRLHFEREAVIREITYRGDTEQTVDVTVDLISKNYRQLPLKD